MTIPEVANRSVLVMGLGRFGGGVGVTRWLCRRGATVTVTDLADEASLIESLGRLADCDVAFHLGGHDERDLRAADLVVVSPAVDRRTSAFFKKIVERQVPWTTEINLFLPRCRGRVIGVTGTAGKSTACALLYEVLKSSIPGGRRVWLGGNVGRSLLTDLDDIGSDDVVVLELSSFQLEAVPQIERSPEIGVVTTIWPNHLERHGDFESYLSAKLNLLRYQQAGQWAVVGSEGPALVGAVRAVTAETGASLAVVAQPAAPYDLQIPGGHNQLNAACAERVAGLLGVSESACRVGLAGFAGLPHRLEKVGDVGGVTYYNDSKSTTPRGTAAALDALDRPVVVIVGGRAGQDDLEPMVRAAATRARAVVCMGACGLRLAAAIRAGRGERSVPVVETAGDLAEAVERARALARPGDAVLLSPGMPSYGDFVNYEHRGEAFVELVGTESNRQ